MASGAPVTTTPEHPPAGPLPNVRWLTLDTPHFHIHYYEDELSYAQHAAIIAERAFRLHTRYLNWLPSGRVNITLEDQTDFADGFASSIPQNFVFGFGAPPSAPAPPAAASCARAIGVGAATAAATTRPRRARPRSVFIGTSVTSRG